MDKPLFSEHWYRVKTLRPRLRAHARLHRHEYRGSIWYVLEDASSSRYHRFNVAAYQVIGMMNGKRTVQQIWEAANTRLGDDAPVQDDIINLLGQLHQMDALQGDIAPDVEELFQRGREHDRKMFRARFKNPLAVRIGLVDPDGFLAATAQLAKPLFSRAFLLLWVLIVALAALLAGVHGQELLATAQLEALTPVNLLLLWLIYPFVKLLHELAHAYATRLQGGEVHEIGIMLLVFTPVPYVDASAATAFRERRMRMLVGAAGIMAELLLAALALFLWLSVEPGLLRSICFNVMLIGGVSTLLFNGNPLLRFDGYYVLADAIGIPNLAQRSTQYLAFLVQHYLFGLPAVRSPAHSRSEAAWFVGYGIASFLYRMVIMAVICLFLIETLFIVGIVLAIWAVYNQLILPLMKQLRFVISSPLLRRNRPRAMLVTGGSLCLVLALLFWLPVSSLTRFEGVIWPPEDSQLVAQTEGFVQEVLAEPGSLVTEGQALLALRNARHQGDMAVIRARLRELGAQSRVARVKDRVQAKLVDEEIAALRGEMRRLQEKIDALVITSPGNGTFVLPGAEDLPGEYVHQGRLLGYVVDTGMATARVVVTQEDQDRINRRVDGIELRVAGALQQVMPGRLVRAVPQASHQLPSDVLSVEGGGPFTPDPAGITPLSTRERLFEYEVELPLTVDEALIGSRVHVRFDHGQETLWVQLNRRLRQLFLRRLNV